MTKDNRVTWSKEMSFHLISLKEKYELTTPNTKKKWNCIVKEINQQFKAQLSYRDIKEKWLQLTRTFCVNESREMRFGEAFVRWKFYKPLKEMLIRTGLIHQLHKMKDHHPLHQQKLTTSTTTQALTTTTSVCSTINSNSTRSTSSTHRSQPLSLSLSSTLSLPLSTPLHTSTSLVESTLVSNERWINELQKLHLQLDQLRQITTKCSRDDLLAKITLAIDKTNHLEQSIHNWNNSIHIKISRINTKLECIIEIQRKKLSLKQKSNYTI